jgi:hypothetical protein
LVRIFSAARQFAKHLRFLQFVVGVGLLGLGYHMGKIPMRLIAGGERGTGIVVDYKERYFQTQSAGGTSRTTSSFMPIVQFDYGPSQVRFEDWKGTSSKGGITRRVPIIFDPHDSKVAMIDRPVWNWLPWSPVVAVGAFLVVVSAVGRRKAA